MKVTMFVKAAKQAEASQPPTDEAPLAIATAVASTLWLRQLAANRGNSDRVYPT